MWRKYWTNVLGNQTGFCRQQFFDFSQWYRIKKKIFKKAKKQKIEKNLVDRKCPTRLALSWSWYITYVWKWHKLWQQLNCKIKVATSGNWQYFDCCQWHTNTQTNAYEQYLYVCVILYVCLLWSLAIYRNNVRDSYRHRRLCARRRQRKRLQCGMQPAVRATKINSCNRRHLLGFWRYFLSFLPSNRLRRVSWPWRMQRKETLLEKRKKNITREIASTMHTRKSNTHDNEIYSWQFASGPPRWEYEQNERVECGAPTGGNFFFVRHTFGLAILFAFFVVWHFGAFKKALSQLLKSEILWKISN